jgi:hypothetical protein
MVAIGVTGTAGAKTNSSPSDERARYETGNAVTCAQAGVTADHIAFADGTGSIDDGAVSGDVTNGTTVNVDDPSSGVTIVAVVVKGGPAYNVYENPQFLPPTLHRPQSYISPLNGGGNIPTVSHWFICYNDTSENPPPPPPPPAKGNLVVKKDAAGDTTNAPATVTIHVDCDDAAHTTKDVVLPGTGGTSDPITGLDPGTTCTVKETTAITGVTPVYSPVNPDDSTEGVGVVASDSTVTVTVTNTYPAVEGEVVTSPTTPPTDTPQVEAATAVAATPGFTG